MGINADIESETGMLRDFFKGHLMAIKSNSGSHMLRRALGVNILSLGLLMTGVGTAHAELSSMKIGRADLVSLSSADTHYGLATTHTDVLGNSRPGEIQALARALQYDPDLIYAYVKNRVEITPLFGLQKGALGTYIDQHGTAFDQANLMAELAKEAMAQAGNSITDVKVVYGQIGLTGAQFDDWLGITDAKMACDLLAFGGIPAMVNGASSCASLSGSVTSVTMKHAWVQLTVSGGTYVFDPAYKVHHNYAGINLPTEMGYSRAGFKAATQGTTGAASGVNYVENISPTGTSSQLSSYSGTLLSNLKTTHKDKTLDEIIGGSVILDETMPVGGWRLAGGDGYTLTAQITAADVPDQFRTTFRVCARRIGATCDGTVPDVWGGTDTINATFYVDEIYGRRMEIVPDLNQNVLTTVNPSVFYARLKVGGYTISGVGIDALHTNYHGPVGRMGWDLELEVDHPYAASAGSYMDRVVETKFDVLTTASIVHGWGHVSNELPMKWGRESGADARSGLLRAISCSPECEPFFASQQNNTKAKIGATWLAQFSQMASMAGDISGGRVMHHHTVGVSYAESEVANDCLTSSPGDCHFAPGDQILRLDLSTGMSAPHTTDAGSNALVHTVAAASSTLEGSLFEQQIDSVDVSSTSERFNWAEKNLTGTKHAKYMLFTPADTGVVDSLVLQQDYDPTGCFGITLTGVYGKGRIGSYLNGGFDEVLAVNDEFLGPGYECGPSEMTKQDVTWTMTHPSLQRGAAFIAVKKDASGNVAEVAHVVTSRNGAYKGGGGANGNDNTEKFDPAKAADILKDEFEDKSVMHGVDLSSGGAAWSSGTILSSGNGGFPYALSLELSVKNGALPQRIYEDSTRHWKYGDFSKEFISGNFKSEATMSGSGMEGMGASHPWNAVGTIAALYTAYDMALDSTGLSNLVLLPFINEWWSDQLTSNVVSVSSPSGGYQFVKLPNGTYNAPVGSTATLNMTGARFAERLSPGLFPDQTRRWNYGNVGLSVITPQKDVLAFNAVAYYTNSNDTITSHKHVLKSVHNAAGFGADFTYDVGTFYHGVRLLQVSNDFGRVLNWVYDASYQYQVDSVNDGNGHSVVFTTQSGNEGFTTPDNQFYGFAPGGGTVTYLRYQLGQVFLPTDSLNAALHYTYDANLQVATVKDANLNSYDFRIAAGFRGERVDPLGNSYSAWYGLAEFDGADVINYGLFVDEIGRTVKTEFDHWGRVAARQYPEGNRSEFDYDVFSNVTALRKTSKDGTTTYLASATYSDPLWPTKPTSVTDFMLNTVTLDYGPSGGNAGQIITATRPAVAAGTPIYRFDYNANGQLRRSIDAVGMVSVVDYDLLGNAIKTMADCGVDTATTTANCAGGLMITTGATFDAIGNQLTATDPNNNVSTNTYDAMRRPWKATDPLGNYVEKEFDALGRETRTKAYDPLNVLLQATYKTYTPTGQEDLVYNPYDPALCTNADDPTTCTPYQGVTDNDYDDADRLLMVTDSEGRQTRTVYNADGSVDRVIRAFGSPLQQDYQTYSYAPSGVNVANYNGQQYSVMDANGNVTKYWFDEFDKLEAAYFPPKKDCSGGACTIASPNAPSDYSGTGLHTYADREEYAYDANGNVLTKRTRKADTITYVYDALNRVTSKTPGADKVVTYEYDLAGRQTQVAYADLSHVITHGYDSAGRLDASNDNGRLLTYDYDPAGNRTGIHWPDAPNIAGVEDFFISYFYDAINRVTAVTEEGMNPAIGFIATYDHDALSRRTQLTYANGRTTEYKYEPDSALDELNHWEGDPDPDPATRTVGYGFDYNLANQVSSRSVSDDGFMYGLVNGKAEGYTPNGLNQYANITRNTVNYTLSYDGNGSLTGDGTWGYVYDVENRLTSATGPGVAAAYEYDPLGRRSRKSGTGVVTEVYLNDGVEEIADADASGNVLRRYVHGPGVDEYLLMIGYDAGTGAETGREFYHADYLGSIIATSEGDAGAGNTVADTYTYSAYGETGAEGPAGNPFRYTGRRLDAETGLYYYRARYYAPALGRFLQTDPIGYGDGMNMYAYVGNDPVNATDPSGLDGSCYAYGTCQSTSQWGDGVIDVAVAYYSIFVHYKGLAQGDDKAKAVDSLLTVGAFFLSSNAKEAVEYFVDNVDKSRLVGRGLGAMALNQALLGKAGKVTRVGMGAAGFTEVQKGLAINAISTVYDQMTEAGLDPAKMTMSALGQTILIGAAGGKMNYDSKSGKLTGTFTVSKTGSRIKREITVEVCTKGEDGGC